MEKKTTDELLNELKSDVIIEDYIKENQNEFTNMDGTQLLNHFLNDKSLKLSEVIHASELSEDYCYKIFRGRRNNPSRDKIIALAIAMRLTLMECKDLLRAYGVRELYARSKRDSIIIFAFQKQIDVSSVNTLLYEFNQPTLDEG